MRLLVCGSRTFSDERAMDPLMWWVDRCDDLDVTVIHGAARGADEMADRLFTSILCEPDGRVLRFPADWSQHGKAAGAIRNQQMIDEGKPDVVWAFVDKPLAESKGTADMVRRARAAGIPTYVTTAEPSADLAEEPRDA